MSSFITRAPRLLTTAEVATFLRVEQKTVIRWAAAGKIASVRTPGGQRRYREDEVCRLLGDSRVRPRGAAR
jgi:excisionase family DNA binding protein